MEILSNVRVYTVFSRYFRKRLTSRRTAVDLAHKVHGNSLSDGGKLPIIVLHGLLGSKRNWESMSKRIASSSGRTVIAVDLRNHGESPHVDSHTYPDLAEDVLQLINKLSITQAVIIGHSMGGRTAMVLSLTEPSKVAGLVIVDISPVSTAGILNDFFPKLLDAMRTVNFHGIDNVGKARAAAKEAMKATGIVQNIESLSFVFLNVGQRYDKKIGWMCNIDALKQYFTTIASFPSEMSGKQYAGPTLFIGGQQSNYIPPADLNRIKAIFPTVQLTYVPGVGHNVHAEDPNAFHKIVIDFLSSV